MSFIVKVRKYLMEKINKDESLISIYEKEKQTLYNIIKLTVTNCESNSAILMGPKECGKSTLINCVIKSLDENINLKSNTIKIYLNGLIHTDDKLALKSCTIQMNLENLVNGKMFSTFADNLHYLLECLRSGERNVLKCLLFIIEEFDLFCLHDNQTLLYNLFDMTHTSEIPICVIGITSRLDVIELFEKRVKSRFSHRIINLFPTSIEIDNRLNLIQKLLSISVSENVPDVKKWNLHVTQLVSDIKFKTAMKRLYFLTKSEKVLSNILIQVVSQLGSEINQLNADCFTLAVQQFENGWRFQQLTSLSVLELCLIIAMQHHSEIFDEPFNFEMIFKRYGDFAARAANLNAPHAVVSKAFEHLRFLEILTPAGSNTTSSEYRLYTLAIRPQLIREVIRSLPLPTELVLWYNAKNV